MAGYTSRIILTFSVPFFGFVLWFLKRKNTSKNFTSKAVQVEDSQSPELLQKRYLELDPMKLLNQPDNCEESLKSAMQIRELQTPEPVVGNGSQTDSLEQNDVSCNGAQHNGTSQNGVPLKSVQQNGTTKQNGASKAKKKNKNKPEKSRTCPSDITANGKQDNVCELANGLEAMGLKAASDELLNAINKSQSEMEVLNGTNSDSRSSVPINGNNATSTETGVSSRTNKTAKECDTELRETNSNSEKLKSVQTEVIADSRESLLLPVDCTSESQGEMLESPITTYCDSLGSTDSGRGGSEIHFESSSQENNVSNYAFEIPQRYVGLLIGRQGKTVNSIKEETNADILIKKHPTSNQNKVCLLSGTEDEINAALRKIRSKFPPERFPSVTLSQICFLPFMPCPENLMLRLPEGSSFDVMLSATVSAGHFFLQQPTHPSFHSLVSLTFQMTNMYNRDLTAPSLPHMEKGYICAAHLGECWYRAEIDEVFLETDECRAKFLDYGGYSILPRSALRQMNYQFMNVPFQATECYLGLVAPLEGQVEWSPEATAAFEELAQGQILQGFIVAYAENGVPFVQLYRIAGVNHIDINMELGRGGLVRYLKPEPSV